MFIGDVGLDGSMNAVSLSFLLAVIFYPLLKLECLFLNLCFGEVMSSAVGGF